MQINTYQEGTKINIEVNEQVMKNIGTHWNMRHFDLAMRKDKFIKRYSLNSSEVCEISSLIVK